MDKEVLRLIDSMDEFITRPLVKLDDEVLICECFCVSVRDIRDQCESEVDLERLSEKFHLGEGCRSCIRRKDDWIDKIF